MRKILDLTIVFLVLIASSAFAEEVPPLQELPGRRPSGKTPVGFHSDFLALSISNGRAIAPSGSFVDHEKRYDRSLRVRTATGGIPPLLGAVTPPIFDSEIVPKESVSGDLEAGVFPYLGMGIFGNYTRINITRQDVVPLSPQVFRTIVEPVPITRTLYRGNTAGGFLSLHPFPGRRVDPYMQVRIGGGGFSGEGHAFLDYDAYRPTNRIRNGTVALYGGALGCNIYVDRGLFFKAETNYAHQILKSNMFASRSLNLYSVNIGIGLDFSRVEP